MIAFTSDRDGDREIYTMNADGSGQTNISNHRSDEFFPESRPNEVPLPPHPELHRPLITVPKDIVKEATGPNGTKVSFEVSAEDI